jgi:DNA-binding GntR family transcriptional regulator
MDWIQDPIMSGPEALRQLVSARGAPHRTATAFAMETLREAILTGALAEGTELQQTDLAASLKLSRTPVREALRLLEAEGWVEFSPHRGAVVATLSTDDIVQVFEIRFALEALALRKSIPALDTASLDRAAAILDEMDVERDIGRWVELNRRFHITTYSGAGARLLAVIQHQYDAVDRYLRLELAELHNADESQEEHRAILAACRAGDAEGAVALLGPHVLEAGIDLAKFIDARRRRTP